MFFLLSDLCLWLAALILEHAWSILRQKCQRLPHQTDAPGMSQVFGRNEKYQYSVPDIFDGTGQQGDMVSEKLDHDI